MSDGNGPARWKPLVLIAVLVLLVPAVIAVASVAGRSSDGGAVSGATPTTIARAPLTSADSSCYDRPPVSGSTASSNASAPSIGVRFTEVTKSAGLCHLQSEPKTPPNCFFNKPTDVPGENVDDAARFYSQCLDERITGGAAVGDYDNDGKPDLYLTQLRKGAPGVLYRNNGDGTFADATAAAHLDQVEGNGNGAAWADIDNDGDLDLVVTTVASPRYFLFVNNGDGTFRDEAVSRGTAMDDGAPHRGFSVAVGDYDNDGFVDLFFTEWEKPLDWEPKPRAHAVLEHNRGRLAPGTFENVTDRAGVVLGDPKFQKAHPAYENLVAKDVYRTASFSAAFVDFDGDGWQDLAVTSDFGTSQLFWNNKDGTFADGTSSARVGKDGNGMGSAFADIDGDGRIDWFVTAIFGRSKTRAATYTGNKLYVNAGNRTFEDVTAGWGLDDGFWGWGTAAVDVDRDGRVDLLMTNGQFTGMFHDILGQEEHVATPKRLWLNRGNGRFDEVAEAAGIRTRADGKGLVVFDADGDGDQDVLMVNNGAYPTFYRNDTPPAANWVRVKIMSSARSGPPEGLGAVVTLTDSSGRRQVQQIGVTTAFLGQSERIADFGLGSADGPVQLDVRWPATGEQTSRNDVSPGTLVIVDDRG